MKFITLLLLFSFLSRTSQAQKFEELINKGEQLEKAQNLSSALDAYNKAISLVLEDMEHPESDKWHSALLTAANLANKMSYKRADASELAQKYWNLAKGTRGESLEEKIAFLKDYGIKDLIIYHSLAYTVPYMIGDCSPTLTKYLLWFKAGKTYIQKFNNCMTFKPLVIEKSRLAAFYQKEKDSVVKQKFTTFMRVYDTGEYDLDFVDPTGTIAKTHFQAYDLIEPKNEPGGFRYKDLEKAMDSYKKNISSSLGKLVAMVWSDVKQYDNQADANSARVKVGQL